MLDMLTLSVVAIGTVVFLAGAIMNAVVGDFRSALLVSWPLFCISAGILHFLLTGSAILILVLPAISYVLVFLWRLLVINRQP